jgi:hypothetical protein
METVALTFSKPHNQPTNAYQLEQIVYFTNGGITGTLYNNDVTTLQEASGSYSGTFRARRLPHSSLALVLPCA